jgi:hypothetical protein
LHRRTPRAFSRANQVDRLPHDVFRVEGARHHRHPAFSGSCSACRTLLRGTACPLGTPDQPRPRPARRLLTCCWRSTPPPWCGRGWRR